MESIIQRGITIIPLILIIISWLQQRDHPYVCIGIGVIASLVVDYGLSSTTLTNATIKHLVLWCLSPIGLLFISDVSTRWTSIGILIFLSGLHIQGFHPISISQLSKARSLLMLLVYVLTTWYLQVDVILAGIIFLITTLSYEIFKSKLSTHDVIIFISSINLMIADMYHMFIVNDYHVNYTQLFSERSCIIVFEVAILSLLLMISLSFIICHFISKSDPTALKVSSSPQPCLSNSASAARFSITTPILIRASVFGVSVVLISLAIIIPVLTHMLTMNPFVWLGMMFQENDYLAVYFTTYWIVVITVFVMMADWAMEKVKLSKTQGRKIFHALMLVMFVPALLMPAILPFVNLCLGGALCIFVMTEFIRLYVFQGDALVINQYFELFVSGNEANSSHSIVLSHISLLLGCSCSIWYVALTGSHLNDITNLVVPFAGLLTVGIGDSAAAIIGSSWGKHKWYGSNKTKEGSIAAFLSMIASTYVLFYWKSISINGEEFSFLCLRFILVALAEVFVNSNDNISLPFYLIMTTICT